MATIERSIEEMIEDTEPVEEPVEVQKPKKARSQKQIESLAKAREARAKKLAEKKSAPSMEQPQSV
eukprot:COSAG02_NODE_43082_length_378_cov_0.917563_1_plen_65_part_10